mmetsp:Transcript_8457/g.24214  ORF Transcript_8457/g.24214 Transcript_8457/m.24214 type:complete len:409 (+) Transcript_8457:120-1346(+)|eukprot:CAMPEP_0176232906 /NCGR_PEP_ID=MMETSP0121_2-20121125/25548_1 /TAXON_ID=160619 /ORGANISM="Kryptoperidinium foliaceum, Strain CCMP 1326" /LENGTH=408 /DNA_ID=CAMNT_0017572279 /DNA_START=120 /DNA_END=1346 /DNA_ORIENTATION=+
MAAADAKMELECTMDEQDVIVLDNGSGCLKVGFSGEDAPRAVIPTITATATLDDAREDEHTGGADSSLAAKKSAAFYGEEALMQSSAVATRPVQRGGIVMSSQQSKDALEALWEHALRNVLGVDGEELPVLIADAMPLDQNSHASRTWTAEVMFEKLKVKSLAIFNTAVLSLFSTGRTRGLVVEAGEGITQAVPVFEGFAIPHAIFKMEVAGQDITAKVRGLMEQELGPERASNIKVMQTLKEKVCKIAPDYHAAMNGPDTDDEEARSFELPDGNIIKVPKQVRTGAPEVLFGAGDPSAPSVQKICYEAITTCDMDFRHDLVRSIVVAGGTSMLPGLAPRFRSELAATLPGELARQVDVCMDSQRRYAAWIGGSMFASLSTFDQVAITKQDYEEGKADVRGLVARKTF